MVSTWPGVKQLRDLLGVNRGEDGREHFTLEIDLSPMGSNERVTELKALQREFQRMAEDAADAARARLRR